MIGRTRGLDADLQHIHDAFSHGGTSEGFALSQALQSCSDARDERDALREAIRAVLRAEYPPGIINGLAALEALATDPSRPTVDQINTEMAGIAEPLTDEQFARWLEADWMPTQYVKARLAIGPARGVTLTEEEAGILDEIVKPWLRGGASNSGDPDLNTRIEAIRAKLRARGGDR